MDVQILGQPTKDAPPNSRGAAKTRSPAKLVQRLGEEVGQVDLYWQHAQRRLPPDRGRENFGTSLVRRPTLDDAAVRVHDPVFGNAFVLKDVAL